MKRLLPVILISLSLISACIAENPAKQTKIKWMTLDEAIKKNSVSKKKIFIDVYTDWCGWCKRMDATTFEDEKVVAYMNANYYSVKLDAETKDSLTFKNKKYGYQPNNKANELAIYFLKGQMGYPTAVYLDEELNLITPVPGYQTVEQLMPILHYFGDNIYKTSSWEDYVKSGSH